MTNIIYSKEFDNSPKTQLVEALEIAFTKRDFEFLLLSVNDDILWKVIGKESVRGISEFKKALNEVEQNSDLDVVELVISGVYVGRDGLSGSIHGTKKYKDNRVYKFSTIYEFGDAEGTRVREIIHYELGTRL